MKSVLSVLVASWPKEILRKPAGPHFPRGLRSSMTIPLSSVASRQIESMTRCPDLTRHSARLRDFNRFIYRHPILSHALPPIITRLHHSHLPHNTPNQYLTMADAGRESMTDS